MSSFSSITKYKYKGNPADLIVLNEYIMFQDDKTGKKYVVFKFKNNVTQQLNGMKFEVSQYNVDGDLLEKSIVVYNQFLAKSEEEFVPQAKLRVSIDCKTLTVKLLEAAFDRFAWKEGEFSDNGYTFDQFYHDEQRTAVREESAKRTRDGKKKEKVKKEKPVKNKKSKHPFVLREATTKNISRFPTVFNVIAFLLLIAFVITSVVLFKNNGSVMTIENYQLRAITEKQVAVCGYSGRESELEIPETLGEYKITKIDEGAFRNSKFIAVSFKCAATVEKDAFADCANLTAVTSDRQLIVTEGAFYNCKSIERISLPNSRLYKGSFGACNTLYGGRLSYGELFGCSSSDDLFVVAE